VTDRVKKTLPRDAIGLFPVLPDTIPTDRKELLDLMDDAASLAAGGQAAGAPLFDHGIRIFNQLNAHYQAQIARDLGDAHHGLKNATTALKVATWWLAGVTVLLGFVEVCKLVIHH
jgi:hypothetical protein